ncbi:MAG: hypothetical protein VB100_12035 [Angelakisella sp.]|nr:hypothetical protein [Angelakisella sp.]
MSETGRYFTPHGIMVCKNGGYCFSFICALCDDGYTTGRVIADSVSEALAIARQEARPYFNRCHKCGRWICDRHYNIDEMMCAECAPLKNTQTDFNT